MATLGSLTLKIRSTRNLLALDLLQCKQEVERFRETANDLLQLKTGVSIDWDSFSRAESEIRRWVDSLPTTNLRVGAKFVGADLQDNIEQLERLLTNPLKIQVDDKRLFELNEHFKLKERDYKQLQSILDSPLSIKVDRSQLDNLSRDLQAIENTPQVNLRANIDLDALRTFHEQLKRYSQGRTLELATSVSRTTLNSLQNDLKALASSLTTARVSVQIDSQLQALRSELGNLPNVTVGVSIDDSALGEFDRKLGNRKLGLGVNPTDISNIDGHINKLGKKLDGLKPASGLFKAVTFAPTQIATGFFQGVGKNLSNGLGKGYSQGIEAALGDTIGSTELLGRKLAEGIASRSKSAISQLVPTAITDALRESINQALGETDVFVESRSRQAIQSKGQRKKKDQSREGVAEERRQATRDFEDNRFEVTALTARSNQLERLYRAKSRVKDILDQKIENMPVGDVKTTDRSRAKLQSISKNLARDISEKSTIKATLETQAANLPAGETRELLESQAATLSSQIDRQSQTKQAVDLKLATRAKNRSRNKLESLSAQMEFDLISVNDEQVKVSKDLKTSRSNLESSEQRVLRADRVYETLKPTQLPKVYRDAVADVPEHLIPEIKVDRGLEAKGASATYSAKSNRIKVSPELYESIQSGNLAQDDFRVMYHELKHGRDFQFGKFQGLIDRDNMEVRKPVKATAQEIKDVAPFLSLYNDDPKLRAVEQNAEIPARRISKKLYEEQQVRSLSSQLDNNFGQGGIKLDRIVNSQVLESAQRATKINQFGESIGIQSPGATKIVDRAIAIKNQQKEIGLDIARAANGELNTTQIDELQTRITKQIKSVEILSKRVDVLKKSILDRVQQAKASVPESVEISTATPKSEGIVIDRDKIVEVATSAGTALRRTVDTGKSVVSGVKNVAATVLNGTRSGMGLLQQGEAMFMNASPQARLLKSQIQDKAADLAENARYQVVSSAGNLGQFAGQVYRGLEAAESVPLSIPGAKTVKKLIQQVAAPTAVATAAHHVPGLGSLLDMAYGGIHTLAGGAGHLLSSGATSGMSSFVADALGSVPFHESVVPAIQQGLGTAVNAAITGGAETAATVAAPVMAGKFIVNTAGSSLGTGLQKIAQSNPLLQPAQKPLALQPKSEPVYDYVEVEPITAAASASQGSNKPTSLNLTPKPKQESKQAEVVPPPKLITQITEPEAIDKAQKFATQFKKAQKAIQKALDDGETQLAFEMGKKIEDYAEIARSEINNIAQLLGDRATTDTPLRDKLNSAKSQITRATNTGARAVTVYQNSNPVAGDELASLKIPKPGEIRDAAAAKLTELRNLFNNSQSPQEPVSPTPLGRPLPPPSNPPVPPKNLPKRNLGSALPPPAQIIPELAARSLNPADLITSIEQKLNYFEGVYPQAERQVRGSEKRGRKNVNKFMGFVDLHQDLFDSSFNRLDRESAKNLQEQQAKTQNLNDRVFTENGITPLGKDVDSLLPKLSDLKNMGAKVISIFAGFAGVAFVGKMLADWGAGAFQAAAKMESLRTTIGAVSASNIKAQSTIARSTTESNKLGYNAVAGLENDAGFFASTRTTALELVAPDIMSGLKSYNRVMGVDENRAKLAQTAVVQMAGKGKITAEELFGQLAESSPGAVNVLSRSMGLSVGQLRKEMESGSLNANDALPRFGNQLSAESLGSIDKSSQSAAASVGRLQNSLAALQVAAGEKIMAPTTLGIVKVTEATDLLKNNIDTLGNIFTAAILSAAASAIGLSAGLGLANPALGLLVKGITLALPLLKTFALQTAVAYAAIELFNTVMNSVNDSSPFKSLADDSEAAFAKISKGASTTKQSIEDLKNEIYGKDRNVFQQIGDGISGTFGGQTSITKKAADDTVNADRLLEQNEKALKRKPVELTEANRIRRSEIDLELSVIRSQNANLTSKDRDKIDINNKKEQKLIEERSNLEKPINTRQAELEQVIKNTNNIIDSPLRNESEKGLAKLQLAEAEKEQRKLQEQLISSASTLSVGLRKVGEGLQAGLAAIDLASINRRTQTYLAAAQDVRNTGALAQANFVDTTTTLSAKQSLQQQAVGSLKSTIYSSENRGTVQALGIDPESVSQEQIDRLKSTVTDTRGQALLGYLSKYQSVKTELAQTNQSLFEAQYNYLKSIADYNKGSIDQVISLQNRLANLSITARNAISSLQQQVEQTLVEIDTTSSKAAFQAQRNKIQASYNKFLEKLGISTDDIFEQIFTNYNSILDTVQQLVERRLGRKQSENTAKFRVFNNETRKYQVEQEQRTGIEDLKRQESERRLGNPLNQSQPPSSGETQPVNTSSSNSNTSLIRPVESKVNSGFGYRNHPVHGGRKFHAGVDYPVRTGTAIKAAGEGVVTFAGTKGGYGNTIDIKHPSGETTRYGHLSKIGVEVGQRVTQGQQVALSGGAKGAPGSGTSTGPHLHFETRNAKGEAIDPIARLKNNPIAQSVTSQPTIARPNPANGKIEQIAAQGNAQSLIVQEVATGRVVADYNSAVQPVSSASTLKLPIARAIQRAVTDGRLSLDRKVQINPDIVAQGDERMVGKSYSVKQLLSSSIKESNNTSANALIALLGGPDGATAAVNQLGFKNSRVGNYFSRPGAKGFNNKTTAADVNKALIEFENSTDPASAIVKQSLRQTPNKFGYRGEVGGKIGNNSKVLGNSGIVDIDGKQYAISQFYETPDSPKARRNLANTTNKIESVISGNRISASQPQSTPTAPTTEASPTTVTSSTYTPGGGGMNGAEKDSRGNRLTRNDYAIAIPGQNRVKDQIPYGSIVKLNYGGKTVNAKVTDGGPYVPGRQLDMTTAAAKALGFNGVGQVGVSLLSLPKGADPDKKYYFGEATYRPKFGKGGSLSVAEANKAIASVVRGDKYVTLGKGVQAEATNDSQPSNSPPTGKGTLGQAILNNITQQGIDKKIAENEKLSKVYVDSVKTFSDRDSAAAKKKSQQERNLSNQQDESDRTKLDTQILKNQNLLDRNIPTFNRKSVELENQAAAYNRSSNNRDAYKKIDSIYSQYGGIPETATQDTAIVTSQSTIEKLREESRVRRENLLKQIQSIEAQGAGWAELKKRIQEQVTSLKKNGFTDDATALEDFIISNDRAIGTPKARQQTINRLSTQYRALPSDGIAVYDSIAPGANKVLTDNKSLNSQYLPKTFDDNLNAEARSIVERFKAAKESLQGEFLKLDEAIGILEAEIQAKLKAAGYAPQKLDLTDPKRLELLNKVAPEQTVVLQQATARRLQLNLSGQNLDRNADTAAARAVSIGQKRERLTVDRANTDYLAATQDGSIFAQIQIDKQRFTQGKTDLDLQFEQGAVSADLYAAKLKQLTLETDTLRNSVLPLRAATKGFFDDAFSGQGVLDGLGNAAKNLALNILKNFQDIISKELGSQLFGSLAAGAGDLQGEAAGGGILGTIFKGLGFNGGGSRPNTNAGLDLGLNSPILPPPSSGGNSGQSFTGFGLNLGLGLLGLPSIPGFATGGMVTSPTLALVGEGINNEAIVPLPNGRSIPVDLRGAGESGGSSVNSSVSVTIQNSGQARETSRGEGQAISQMIKGAVMDVLVNERRPGGLLN